jgi:hypothetical protein
VILVFSDLGILRYQFVVRRYLKNFPNAANASPSICFFRTGFSLAGEFQLSIAQPQRRGRVIIRCGMRYALEASSTKQVRALVLV